MTETILTSQSLVIEYKSGINEEGKDVFKRQRYSNLSESAADDSLYEIGNAIGQILNTEIYRISKENKFELLKI